jgi:hypothetical protein
VGIQNAGNTRGKNVKRQTLLAAARRTVLSARADKEKAMPSSSLARLRPLFGGNQSEHLIARRDKKILFTRSTLANLAIDAESKGDLNDAPKWMVDSG